MSPSIFIWTQKQTKIVSDLRKTMLVKPQLTEQKQQTIEEGISAQTPKPSKRKSIHYPKRQQ